MTEFRRVTDLFSVAPQISIEDVALARAAGFTVLINNRPDGEEPGQPSSNEIQAAATAQRMYYAYIPVVGPPTTRQAEAVHDAVSAGGVVLAYCRSGARSINTWAMGELMAGTPKDVIVELAAGAGYDLRA